NYQCDVALAGGVFIRFPQRLGHYHVDGMIKSRDGRTRTFDENASGTLFGNGLGVVALKRLSDAVADGDVVRAVIKCWAVNNDGAGKVGYTAPSIDGQAAAMRAALAMAGLAPSSVGYVEAHGTATPLGDPVEVAALTRAYGGPGSTPGSIALGSVKTNF